MLVAGWRAVPPPGIAAERFAAAALADTYEVLADLVGVTPVVLGGEPSEVAELLWPGSVGLAAPPQPGLAAVVARLISAGLDVDECVVVPADMPDLPALVLAKAFKALGTADLVVAPARGGSRGSAALGVRVPWPSWLPPGLHLDLSFSTADLNQLRSLAPRRNAVAEVTGWHRLTTPGQVGQLDPGLEGWDRVRLLLEGR